MASSPRISVKVGKLAEPLKTVRIKKGMKLAAFLEENDLSTESVRVNGEHVAQSYVLKNGDIITMVDHVSGGR